mmetsp:Transcript_11178/g.12643  ORF Transcript_11178/g.12643 Transcript_11178/m.12643 type:complete len:83 (+) Transcript_11178:1195-1443(+)
MEEAMKLWVLVNVSSWGLQFQLEQGCPAYTGNVIKHETELPHTISDDLNTHYKQTLDKITVYLLNIVSENNIYRSDSLRIQK